MTDEKVLSAEQIGRCVEKSMKHSGFACTECGADGITHDNRELTDAVNALVVPIIQAARLEAAAKMREDAVKTLCEWCAQGNVAEVRQEWRANDGSTHWHRVYDNWLACQASRIDALPLPVPTPDALERIVEEAFEAGQLYERTCRHEFHQRRSVPNKPDPRALADEIARRL